MLDIKFIRENRGEVERSLKMRRRSIDLDKLLEMDDERHKLQLRFENFQAKKNRVSKEIVTKKDADKKAILNEMKKMDVEQAEVEGKLRMLKDKMQVILLEMPNILDSRVPQGASDKENKEIKKWGDLPKFKFEPKDHITLGKELDIIDFESGVKVAGSRSYILKGDGARLEQALIKYAQDFITNRGYCLLIVPVLINKEILVGAGFFPEGEEQVYYVQQDDKYLVGTSEASICGMHMNDIVDGQQLPLKYAGVSSCFRREAGTYGKDTQGLYRVHQFNKVEQLIICKNDKDESERMHAELQKNTEDLLQSLKLPYRIVVNCSGDLAAKTAYMVDLETWMPSREGYGETHSCSILYDYQARRLNLRYRDADGKIHFCHTLNNTVIATPRILIPILEIYQNVDGSITIPEVLRPYMAGQERIVKK
ncbi:MAG: serine--tRNA ligase [Candidatus Falkowbacteria bacterium]